MDNWYTTVQLAAELFRRGFGMVGTYRTDRKPHLTEISLNAFKPTARVPKGSTRIAHNESGTVVVYQVMDNRAVTIVDNYYDSNDPFELIRVERHSIIKNALNVPIGLANYNAKMGGADAVGSIKSGHYSFENIRTTKWNLKFDEVLLSFYMTQGWVIYRDIHGTDDREDFQLDVILYFMNHRYFNRSRSSSSSSSSSSTSSAICSSTNKQHYPIQTPEGSGPLKSGFPTKKRYRARCKAGCIEHYAGGSSGSRSTNWYCVLCKQFLHPGKCFDSFHDNKNALSIKADSKIIEIERNFKVKP